MLISQRVLAAAVLALVGFGSSAIANVLTVAPSGAQYTQIQAAVNAAVTGDVILISPATYFAAATIDGKSLTLVNKGPTNLTIYGTISVKNLTAGQRVVLSGLRSFGQPNSSGGADAGVGLYVSNNAGHVRVENCAFFGADGLGDGFGIGTTGCCWAPPEGIGRSGAFVIGNTLGVSFAACEFQGGRSADSTPAFPVCYCGASQQGGTGLGIQSTLVSLYDCTLRGGRGGHNGGEGGRGGAACVLVNGAPITGVCSSGSLFRGGNGGDGWDSISGYPGSGGSGLYLSPGTSARLLDNAFVQSMPGTSAGWAGYPGPNITGGGTVHTDSESRLVMTTDRVVRGGSVVNVRVQGTPGQVIYLRVSDTPAFMILPSWHGTLLSLRSLGSVDTRIGTIPANGILQRRYLAPQLPAGTLSSTAFVQAYRADPVLGPKLSAGTSITLLR